MESANDNNNNIQYLSLEEESNKKVSFKDQKSIRSSKALLLNLSKETSSFDYNPQKENRVSRYFSKKKSQRMISEDTIIYDILFDYLDDNKKVRNYERVSNEIKKMEQKEVVER